MQSPNPQSSFNWRGFTSLMLFFGFLLILISGSILYIAPRGRTANWSGWEILGFSKEEWTAVHITTAFILIVMSGLHLVYNWRVFVSYLKSKQVSGFRLRKELVASLSLTALCWFGTIWELPPFRNMVAFSDSMKDYWERNTTAAPVAHAEELSLVKVAEQAGMEPEELATRLREAGYTLPDTEASFGNIAKLNQVTPKKLFETALIPVPQQWAGRGQGNHGQGNRGQQAGGVGGRGYGRMTLGELCTQENIAIDQAITQLEKLGVNATESQSIRDLADQIGVTPSQILPVLQGTP